MIDNNWASKLNRIKPTESIDFELQLSINSTPWRNRIQLLTINPRDYLQGTILFQSFITAWADLSQKPRFRITFSGTRICQDLASTIWLQLPTLDIISKPYQASPSRKSARGKARGGKIKTKKSLPRSNGRNVIILYDCKWFNYYVMGTLIIFHLKFIFLKKWNNGLNFK